MRYVDVGIFAYNEERGIGFLLDDLARQSLIVQADIELRIHVLCNGCRDNTVSVARDTVATQERIRPLTVVDDFPEAGKSRTWNRFVKDIHANSQFVIFMDGDIRLKDSDALLNLLDDLYHSNAVAITSRPIKDLNRLRHNPFLRVVACRIGRNHRDGPICGQLYAVKTDIVRQIRLPVPCLVEDGFLSACLVTGLFSHQGRPELVKASQQVSHFFEVPGSLYEFFQHDVRLALGCEFNAAFYSDLWAAKSVQERLDLLWKFAESVGIDRSIDIHQQHPARSALAGNNVFSQLFGGKKTSIVVILLRFPFRLLHCLYMVVVRLQARRLFLKRIFQW